MHVMRTSHPLEEFVFFILLSIFVATIFLFNLYLLIYHFLKTHFYYEHYTLINFQQIYIYIYIYMYKLSAKSYMQIHLVKEGEKNVMQHFHVKRLLTS